MNESLFGPNKYELFRMLEEQVYESLYLLEDEVISEIQEALWFAPTLVLRETRAIDFLRTEDFHTLKAARRMALYWQLRKELFEDRWLLPLNQTGAGALTADQVELLRTGFFAFPLLHRRLC